jgi:RNA polymerase sigma-70 factor, ECF subfamily
MRRRGKGSPGHPGAAGSPSKRPHQPATVSWSRCSWRATFVSLVRAQHAFLVRLALVFVGSRATAEEVAQETWSRFLAALPRFEGRSSLRTWIYRICTNAALTRPKDG